MVCGGIETGVAPVTRLMTCADTGEGVGVRVAS